MSGLNWKAAPACLLTGEYMFAVGTGVPPHANQLRFDPTDQFVLLLLVCNRNRTLQNIISG